MVRHKVSSHSPRRTPAIGSFCAALLLLLTLAACGTEKPQPQAQGEVPIGAVLPLSGENASFGTTARFAYQIAEEDAARQGLPKIRLVYGDSKLDKDLALKEYRRLVDMEKVAGFVEITGSGVALAVAPVAEKDQIPIVSGINTSPELTDKGGKYFFRVISSDAYSGKVLSDWTVEAGLRRAALVFNQQNGWATGFKSAITSAYRARGGELPDDAIVPVSDDTVDFSGAIARLKQSQPQVWFVGLMGRQAALFVKQASEKGVSGPFFGVDNLAQTEFVQGAGRGLTNTKLALPAEVQGPRGQDFARRYKALAGRDADAIAYKAYDAYMVIADAIKNLQAANKPVNGPNLKEQLEKTRMEGLTGVIEFDEHHDLREATYDRLKYSQTGEKVPDAAAKAAAAGASKS
jgi:branched-chain amino acid transport system substrate-binding protein